MPRYLLSVFHQADAARPPVQESERIMAQVSAHQDEMTAAGVRVFVGTLTAPDSATVVQATERGMSLSDGPYAEAKEQIGGFTVIDVADLDEALEWARKGSEAAHWPVEVRPFADGAV